MFTPKISGSSPSNDPLPRMDPLDDNAKVKPHEQKCRQEWDKAKLRFDQLLAKIEKDRNT